MFASSFLRFTKELVTSLPLWAAPCKMQMKFLLQHCQSISWEVSYLSFHKIVSAVQGIFLPIRVLKCLCSFQLYFCFSQAQCSIFQDSLSAKFSSSPQSTTCPRSIFPEGFCLWCFNKFASRFLTLIHILELIFPGDLSTLILVVNDLLTTRITI